jgi:hypothetical protein
MRFLTRAAIRVWLVTVCVLTLPSVARASNPKWSDEELARFSDAIVTGRVTDISSGRDLRTNAIYTYVTLLVESALKGDIPEREIIVKQLGGEVGGEGLGVSEQATFSRGEQVLLFLETRPRDKTLYTSALWQGKWTIDRDAASGEMIATRRSGGESRGIFTEPERRSLAPFLTRVRTVVAEAPAPAERGFVAAPPAEEMRAASHAASVVGGAPYTLFNPPWRWNEYDSGTSIPMDMQSSGQPGLAGGGTAELSRAVGVWSSAVGIRIVGGGNTNRCFGGGSDGRISIVFNDPCGEISNTGNTLAIGGASYSFSGGRTVGGIAFYRAVAGYIVDNDSSNARSYLTSSTCFQSTNTHELGHVLGLDHSSNSSAIMYAIISSSCFNAPIPISADDTAGIRAIYQGATTPTGAPGTPTGLTTSSSGSSVTISWNAPSSGGAPTSYVIEAGSAAGLANLANFSTGNTATTFSTSGVGSGSYYTRVRASNSAGTSGASNESLLVVGGGGCTSAPGAPSGFTLTGNSGGTVSFSWGGSSGATTYIIEAGSTPGSANLANSDLGSSATSATFTGVGAGTYYVRLRARNTCGTSGVSNEVTLVVGSSPTPTTLSIRSWGAQFTVSAVSGGYRTTGYITMTLNVPVTGTYRGEFNSYGFIGGTATFSNTASLYFNVDKSTSACPDLHGTIPLYLYNSSNQIVASVQAPLHGSGCAFDPVTGAATVSGSSEAR